VHSHGRSISEIFKEFIIGWGRVRVANSGGSLYILKILRTMSKKMSSAFGGKNRVHPGYAYVADLRPLTSERFSAFV